MTKDDIAQLMQDTSGMIWGDEAHFQRFAKHLIDIEREACAGLLESRKTNANSLIDAVRDMEAAAIRKRSNT